MNKNDFEKTINELQKIKEQNNKKILDDNKKIKISKLNQIEYKVGITFFLSWLTYIILMIPTMICLNNIDITKLIDILPYFSYPTILIGSSLIIGVTISNLLEKKYKTKEKFQTFSNAKTKAEKIENEVSYQIELEQAQNRNRVIDESLKLINTNQTIINQISTRYDLKDKNAPKNKTTAIEKNKELNSLLNKELQKLDILTNKKVLYEKFNEIRKKSPQLMDYMTIPIIIGTILMLSQIPNVLVFQEIARTHFISAYLSSTVIPFATGVIGGTFYIIKRNQDYKTAFNNLNTNLGSEKLTNTIEEQYTDSEEEKQAITQEINDLIKNISVINVQSQEQQRYLENYSEDNQINKTTTFIDENIENKTSSDTLNKSLTLVKKKKPDFKL